MNEKIIFCITLSVLMLLAGTPLVAGEEARQSNESFAEQWLYHSYCGERNLCISDGCKKN